MSKATKPVLLVGGVPGETPEEVFRACGPVVGDLAIGLTDGEVGQRRMWIVFVAVNIYAEHPDLELVRKPKGVEGMPWYVPSGYDDLPLFKVKNGVKSLTFNRVGYADAAKASYAKFRALRDEGVIPQGARFQQSLPFPEDATRTFLTNADDFEIVSAAYTDAIAREVQEIADNIPAHDLVIQWDVMMEVVSLAAEDRVPPLLPWPPKSNPLERFSGFVNQLCPNLPAGIVQGIHLCYGDLAHQHILQPKDLGDCVRLANAGVAASKGRVNYFHMPVPKDRSDDAYFTPLKDLHIGERTLYIGLVHYTDGIEGTRQRLDTFKRHYTGSAGIATECGMGRRPNDHSLQKLLQIHREAALSM